MCVRVSQRSHHTGKSRTVCWDPARPVLLQLNEEGQLTTTKPNRMDVCVCVFQDPGFSLGFRARPTMGPTCTRPRVSLPSLDWVKSLVFKSQMIGFIVSAGDPVVSEQEVRGSSPNGHWSTRGWVQRAVDRSLLHMVTRLVRLDG